MAKFNRATVFPVILAADTVIPNPLVNEIRPEKPGELYSHARSWVFVDLISDKRCF